MLSTKLMQFGLSEKEVMIYLALLESGNATVSEIAKKTKIKRSTSYVILESLAKQGLVSIADRRAIRFYIPIPPERFLSLSEERLRASQQLVELAKNLVPQLKSLYKGVGVKPTLQFFEGEEGLKSIYEDTLTSHETIRAYASIDDMHNVLPGYFPDYYQRRAKKGIKIRAIFPKTEEAINRTKHNPEEAREALLVPSDKYAFTPEINIYDNKIVFMSLRERFGLVIESIELSDAFKKIFELSWEEAKRLNK